MSAKNATLPCTALHGLGITLNSMTDPFKNKLKDDKKVEVRWLELESDLYFKQWLRRYRQIEGIDGNTNTKTWNKSLLEHYEDWYLTARSILDIDVEYMNTKDFNKFNLENYNHSFDFFINTDQQNLLFNIDDSLDEDCFSLDNIMQFEAITLDPRIENNPDIISALKANNLIIKNGQLELCKKGKNNEKEKITEKPTKKAPKTQTKVETKNISNESSNTSPASPSKSLTKSPRKANQNKQRPRPTTTRRQMYICEFPGCSYQSDRNFNFLRHKRTHGKPKNDENKKVQNSLSTSEFGFENTAIKMPSLNESSLTGLELNSINNNDLMNISSQSQTLSNELNLNLAPCNLTNISENNQPFSLANNDYMEKQNIIKDINNFENSFADNQFANSTLDQPFLTEKN